MAALVVKPLAGVGYRARLTAWLRSWVSRRLLGLDVVVLEGHVRVVRPVPLGVARHLVPAIVRCSRRFAAWEIDEGLYEDLVCVLSLGLGMSPRQVEQLSIPLWELTPVIDRIARVNGMPVLEAGRADAGKLLAALTTLTGTNTSPGSSMAPAGPGNTLSTT